MFKVNFSLDFIKKQHELSMKNPDYREAMKIFQKQIAGLIDEEILKDIVNERRK